ncbi:TolC family protein [Neisseria leonii]|uniref:TolC family protein n=1 Tax=Neisseria leonii TaxID=2995413 RepID=A0A9X4IDJ2_9NEIS|nr:TolC family protein [Neisseria sp. 51.81]MDD9327746.1 TolC family protein [Neisseria sp. 51.81]
MNPLQSKAKTLCVLSASVMLMLAPWAAQAAQLQDILRYSLVNDPRLMEAKANEDIAKSATAASKAGHYPVLSLVGNQVMYQQNDRSSDDMTGGLGLRGTLNLYSWGGVEAAVNRDRQNEIFYRHKTAETREELGSTIGKLYLEALRALDAVRLNEKSLARHNKLLQDLSVIVKYDAGRRSEMVEAQARRLQVQTTIAQQQRTLAMALSRLASYTPAPVAANDLTDPFRSETAAGLISRYRIEDYGQTPSYLAQKAERERTVYERDAAKATRKPAINLESYLSNKKKQVYLNLSWNFFDMAAAYNVDKSVYTVAAAEARMDQILRDVSERARTAQVDMIESERRAAITAEHIAAQQEVVKAFELQFKIARRSLVDVLDAYSQLVNIEQAYSSAQNDFRDAALAYLTAQSKVSEWAGLTLGTDNGAGRMLSAKRTDGTQAAGGGVSEVLPAAPLPDRFTERAGLKMPSENGGFVYPYGGIPVADSYAERLAAEAGGQAGNSRGQPSEPEAVQTASPATFAERAGLKMPSENGGFVYPYGGIPVADSYAGRLAAEAAAAIEEESLTPP